MSSAARPALESIAWATTGYRRRRLDARLTKKECRLNGGTQFMRGNTCLRGRCPKVGGDQTKSDVDSPQVIDSSNRKNRKNTPIRPSEIHAGYTELACSSAGLASTILPVPIHYRVSHRIGTSKGSLLRIARFPSKWISSDLPVTRGEFEGLSDLSGDCDADMLTVDYLTVQYPLSHRRGR